MSPASLPPSSSSGDARPEQVEIEPVRVDTARLIEAGLGVWTVVLVLLLVFPALRTGERHWWPWVAVAGLAVGALGWAYVRRGRGNATAA